MIQLVPRSEHSASELQQDKQCTYNVTLRCARPTIVAVKKAV